MADNVVITSSNPTGAVIKTDDVGSGVQIQYVKLDAGGDGVSTPVTASSPLPVEIKSSVALTINGTANVNVTNGSIPVTGPLTDTQLRLTPVPVSGTFYPGTQPISAVSLPDHNVTVLNPGLTDTQLRATPVPVSGTVAISGTTPVSAASLPLPTGAATEATLAAMSAKTPALGSATAANSSPVVIASDQGPLAVTGSFSSAATDVSTTGTITTNGGTVTLNPVGNTALYVYGRGTYVATINFEGTYDGTNYVPLQLVDVNTGAAVVTATASATVKAKADIGGMSMVRARSSAYTSGTFNVNLNASGTADAVTITSPIPAGTNSIGTVVIGSGTLTTVSTVTAVTTVGTLSNGQTAEGVAITGNAVRIGGRAHTANPTARADGQAVNFMADKVGKMVTAPFAPRELNGSAVVTVTASTTAVSLIAATASIKNDIVGMTVTCSSASTGTVVEILDVSTVMWSAYIPALGGGPVTLAVPLKQAAVNTAWNVRTATSTSSVIVSVQYVANV